MKKHSGFTIVELLVVIVVIGVLATITIVAYSGISQRARIAVIQSDLGSASDQLKIYQAQNDDFPMTLDSNNCPLTPVVDTNNCLKFSPGNTFEYQYISPQVFVLDVVNSSVAYRITDDSTATATSCPIGFILVPGSTTYSTSDFCVMKYEAKNVDGKAKSQATGNPWTSDTQTNFIAAATAACSGCHLITEAEWLTVAKNVLSVSSNWSGNAVGSGYIYSGHNDSHPFNSIPASISDSDGYYLTENNSTDATVTNGIVGKAERRTLTLSNGGVIWDLAGNVFEFTAGTTQTPKVQPGVTGSGYAWREWTAITNAGTVTPNPSPTATGISGASGWNSTKGVGIVYSSSDQTGLRVFNRSGGYSYNTKAGVLLLDLDYDNTYARSDIGFRVTRAPYNN